MRHYNTFGQKYKNSLYYQNSIVFTTAIHVIRTWHSSSTEPLLDGRLLRLLQNSARPGPGLPLDPGLQYRWPPYPPNMFWHGQEPSAHPLCTPTFLQRRYAAQHQGIVALNQNNYSTLVPSAKGRVAVEHYFEEVLEGAHLIEAQCSKNIMFEWHVFPFWKQCFIKFIKAVFILLPESFVMPPVRLFMYICI